MSKTRELIEAMERFDALLKRAATREAEWQRLFADCPYILSRSLPLRIEPRQIQALGRPGQSEPDFVIHPEPTQYGSPRGIIELKPPQSHVLTLPRKNQVILTRAAATAVHQVHCYANQPLWPDRMLVLGNHIYLFVIMGIAKNWADRIQDDVFRQQIDNQLRGVQLFGYDQLFTNYCSSVPRRVLLLVSATESRVLEGEEPQPEEEKQTRTHIMKGMEESGFTCGVCGNPIYRRPNGGLIVNSHYCSTACMHDDDIAM